MKAVFNCRCLSSTKRTWYFTGSYALSMIQDSAKRRILRTLQATPRACPKLSVRIMCNLRF
jgi:hypothetical protein